MDGGVGCTAAIVARSCQQAGSLQALPEALRVGDVQAKLKELLQPLGRSLLFATSIQKIVIRETAPDKEDFIGQVYF